MLGKRRADEEGSHVRKTWKAWLLSEQAPVTNVDEDVTNATLHPSTTSKGLGIKSSTNDELNERRSERESGPNTVSDAPVVFQKDGGFARTVAADNVKIVPGKMFVRTDQNGNALTKEGEDAIFDQLDEEENQESMFTIVYIPPNFKARILTFIGALWVTGCIGLFVAFCTPCKFSFPSHLVFRT